MWRRKGAYLACSIRPLDRLDQWKASPIAEPGAREPFFSPDDEWIGFRVRLTIKRASLKGGPTETIGDLPSGSATVHGISWNSDGTILVGAGPAGLVRMRSVGGDVETLAKSAKGGGIMYPQALPGGRAVLYTETAGTADSGELMLLDVGTGKSTPLRSGSAARYLPTGHLVFISGGSLLAVAFDVDRLQMYGAAVPIFSRGSASVAVARRRVSPPAGLSSPALARGSRPTDRSSSHRRTPGATSTSRHPDTRKSRCRSALGPARAPAAGSCRLAFRVSCRRRYRRP